MRTSSSVKFHESVITQYCRKLKMILQKIKPLNKKVCGAKEITCIMQCKYYTAAINLVIVFLLLPSLYCSSIQNVFGPHISVLSQSFESDTSGLRVYSTTETMDQKKYDSLKLSLSSLTGIQNNGKWRVTYIKKDWSSISNSFKIEFENDGSDTAYGISFKLKITTENGYSYVTTEGGSLAPGYKRTINRTIDENAKSVIIDKINY